MSNLSNLHEEFERLSAVRKCGLNIVAAKIENMQARHEINGERDYIKRISKRMKSFDSTMEKCRRKKSEKERDETDWSSPEDFLPTIEYVNKNIQDLAGIRVITHYLDDIEKVCNDLIADEDIDVKCIKDYITNPKGSGYRSLHMIVNVTVNGDKNIPIEERVVPLEIQIRTSLMDAWASIEHKLVYKASREDVLPETKRDLTEMSNEMHNIDIKLVQTRNFEETSLMTNEQIDTYQCTFSNN